MKEKLLSSLLNSREQWQRCLDKAQEMLASIDYEIECVKSFVEPKSD